MARRAAPAAPTFDPGVRIALLIGPEAYLRAEYTRQLRDALTEAHGGLDSARFDGAGDRPGDVLEECRSMGLLSPHKLVVCDNADQLVKESARPMFENYAQSPSDSATLVLRAAKWNKGKLDKLIEGVGVIARCDPIADHQAVNWCVKRMERAHNSAIELDAARLLVERVGSDLVRLDTELAKLAAVLDAKRLDAAASEKSGDAPASATSEIVASMVGKSREEQVWGIQADLLSGDPWSVSAALHEALHVSRHPPVLISFAMCDLARKLHAMSAGIASGEQPRSLAKTLKLWPPEAAGAVERAARTLGPHACAGLLDACVRTDRAMKSGLGDDERNIERTALGFALALGAR